MIVDFPVKRQPTIGSCLPTAILAVFEYYQRLDITEADIARICRVTSGGFSHFETAMDGLATEFDVEDLAEDWERIIDAVVYNDEPVIVTIAHPFLASEGDHAVVLIGITDDDQVVYMDPATETNESLPLQNFQQYWDTPGQRAFVLRP